MNSAPSFGTASNSVNILHWDHNLAFSSYLSDLALA
eukprot:CAMPEP_0115347458 /NCGR_PEP_ID=MMETSP0270-20121206/94893_1 /TAXON_ID=71861 /ORGANISM="Scrippsiella trochoidea, Strain CCMP3099" /LENGTH=35 /DNA_ID= /DNA_START= /DNA_END= /DNA_ORIENTATION=